MVSMADFIPEGFLVSEPACGGSGRVEGEDMKIVQIDSA